MAEVFVRKDMGESPVPALGNAGKDSVLPMSHAWGSSLPNGCCAKELVKEAQEARNPRQKESDLPKGLGWDLNPDLHDFRADTSLLLLSLWSSVWAPSLLAPLSPDGARGLWRARDPGRRWAVKAATALPARCLVYTSARPTYVTRRESRFSRSLGERALPDGCKQVFGRRGSGRRPRGTGSPPLSAFALPPGRHLLCVSPDVK
ncbi:radial spoke head component 9 [Phyllostomus discolor]|uniref:Radial spoke head component 9 n=1 Tax=Phyllostomus discolor TaxID=89673 RepID=A0A834AU36_9CHIR|nr:radial spoke head component 9 [Phyllostomus discolor]